MTKKGWLALDIDGTLTAWAYTIPKEVEAYLKYRYSEGWKIIILSGRSYPFALLSVAKLDFPYILSTQNGSSARHMPSKELIFENFLDKEFFLKMVKRSEESGLALIGYGEDCKCYYKNDEKYNEYIDGIALLSNQEKVRVNRSTQLPEKFPLIKFAGSFDAIQAFKKNLEKSELCEAVGIQDPFHDNFYLLLITKRGVSKGSCVDKIKSLLQGGGVVIAAGNDHNDLSMFDRADISIAMEGSPEELLQEADIIAPSSKELGIIEGLDLAIDLAFRSNKRAGVWK